MPELGPSWCSRPYSFPIPVDADGRRDGLALSRYADLAIMLLAKPTDFDNLTALG